MASMGAAGPPAAHQAAIQMSSWPFVTAADGPPPQAAPGTAVGTNDQSWADAATMAPSAKALGTALTNGAHFERGLLLCKKRGSLIA